MITPRTVKNENGQSYPSIYIDNPYEGWIKLGQYVKNVIPMPTIGITGSAGKTTSTMLAKCVCTERYKVFLSGGYVYKRQDQYSTGTGRTQYL